MAYNFRTNTGSIEHRELETYFELNILDGIVATTQAGKLSIYNSYAYIRAKYVTGKYAGNKVEYAPTDIERIGLNYTIKRFSFNTQYSYTSKNFADTANTLFDINGIEGMIPSNPLIGISSSWQINK